MSLSGVAEGTAVGGTAGGTAVIGGTAVGGTAGYTAGIGGTAVQSLRAHCIDCLRLSAYNWLKCDLYQILYYNLKILHRAVDIYLY